MTARVLAIEGMVITNMVIAKTVIADGVITDTVITCRLIITDVSHHVTESTGDIPTG